MNDTEILDWIEKNPEVIHYHVNYLYKPSRKYWYRLFGPKDETNRFETLREAVIAQQKDKNA